MCAGYEHFNFFVCWYLDCFGFLPVYWHVPLDLVVFCVFVVGYGEVSLVGVCAVDSDYVCSDCFWFV